MHSPTLLLTSLFILACTALHVPIMFRRDPPLNCANIFGIDATPAGDACYEASSGVPICAVIQCEKLKGKPEPSDGGLGDCAKCTCANSGNCKASCDPSLMAPNGKPCNQMCTTCNCNTYACIMGGNGNQGGGPPPGGDGGEA